ncbi:MAG: LamG domain-containing protein [Methylococcaceae bacterium]|nr:MAG: LamG domain-containing protein [Methylococcaceae bacterium]
MSRRSNLSQERLPCTKPRSFSIEQSQKLRGNPMKRFSIIVCATQIVLSLYCTAATAAPLPVMLLDFNKQAADESFIDASGNGNNAICVSDCNTDGDAVFFYSWDWLEVPDSPQLNPRDEFSVAAWIYPANAAYPMDPTGIDDWFVVPQKILGKVTGDFDGGYVLGLEVNAKNRHKYTLFAETWDSTGKQFSLLKGTVDYSVPSHVAMTWKKRGTMKTYVNGKLVGVVDTGRNPIGENSNPFRIGIAPWDTNALLFEGDMDNVAFFRKELSPAQIKALMNKPSAFDRY